MKSVSDQMKPSNIYEIAFYNFKAECRRVYDANLALWFLRTAMTNQNLWLHVYVHIPTFSMDCVHLHNTQQIYSTEHTDTDIEPCFHRQNGNKYSLIKVCWLHE